jgi:hypothetical protein
VLAALSKEGLITLEQVMSRVNQGDLHWICLSKLATAAAS